MSVWCIVVAAGGGQRFGAAKQFARLGDERVVDHAVGRARPACDAVVVVLPLGCRWDGAPVAQSVAGGATRAESVRRGLAVVPHDAEIIVVHDAARPLASSELFARVITAVRDGAEAAIPAIPVADTLKRVEDGRVRATVSREGLVAVQTPQAFRAVGLRTAHADAGEATDDAALVEALGGRVVVVPGELTNRKVTSPEDLLLAEAALVAAKVQR